jgi:hypothetical protein
MIALIELSKALANTNTYSLCHGWSSSTRIDLEDTNMTRRKPDRNKKTRIVLARDLEYMAPKTGVELEYHNY